MEAKKIYGIFVSTFDKNQKPVMDYTSISMYRSKKAAKEYLKSMVQAFNGVFLSDNETIRYYRDDNTEVIMSIAEHFLH